MKVLTLDVMYHRISDEDIHRSGSRYGFENTESSKIYYVIFYFLWE